MAETLTGKSTGRWWEYYFLRYFVGTVVGAILIIFLLKLRGSPLYGLPLVNDLSSLGVITALGALGFAYCYIASAPMLLLHATRAQFGLDPSPVTRRISSVALTFAVIACLHLVVVWRLSIDWWSYRSLGALVFLTVIVVQGRIVVDAYLDRFSTITAFYVELANARAKENQAVEEYVESYRHLREHGNACAILVLEFVLALVLDSAQDPVLAVLAVALWLIPSAFAWLVGSRLEASTEWRKWPENGNHRL